MWREYLVEGYNDTRWLIELWSTQTKVEVVVLKAAWHWDSNSCVVNDPLGEPGHTLLYVGLLSSWCSVDGDHVCSPVSWESSLTGDSERCE